MDDGRARQGWAPPPPPQQPADPGWPVRAPRPRRVWPWVLGGTAALLLLVGGVVGLLAALPDDGSSSGAVASGTLPRGDEPGATGGVALPAGEIDVEDLAEGHCFEDPQGGIDQVATVETVPCGQPHDNEVYLIATFDDGPDALFPDDTERESMIEEACLGSFEDFAGVSYELSILDVFTLEPSPQSWEAGDRELVCAAYRVDGEPMVGSQRGRGERYEEETTRT